MLVDHHAMLLLVTIRHWTEHNLQRFWHFLAQATLRVMTSDTLQTQNPLPLASSDEKLKL